MLFLTKNIPETRKSWFKRSLIDLLTVNNTSLENLLLKNPNLFLENNFLRFKNWNIQLLLNVFNILNVDKDRVIKYTLITQIRRIIWFV